jgi:hypothetical protein
MIHYDTVPCVPCLCSLLEQRMHCESYKQTQTTHLCASASKAKLQLPASTAPLAAAHTTALAAASSADDSRSCSCAASDEGLMKEQYSLQYSRPRCSTAQQLHHYCAVQSAEMWSADMQDSKPKHTEIRQIPCLATMLCWEPDSRVNNPT